MTCVTFRDHREGVMTQVAIIRHVVVHPWMYGSLRTVPMIPLGGILYNERIVFRKVANYDELSCDKFILFTFQVF